MPGTATVRPAWDSVKTTMSTNRRSTVESPRTRTYILVQVSLRQHQLADTGGRRLSEVNHLGLVLTDVVHQHDSASVEDKRVTSPQKPWVKVHFIKLTLPSQRCGGERFPNTRRR